MARGFEVDFIKQTITITDEDVIDADGATEIASLQNAGYRTVKARKRSKSATASRGKTKDYYKNALTEAQWRTFEKLNKEKSFFSARKWAEEQLSK